MAKSIVTLTVFLFLLVWYCAPLAVLTGKYLSTDGFKDNDPSMPLFLESLPDKSLGLTDVLQLLLSLTSVGGFALLIHPSVANWRVDLRVQAACWS
jgi:hypothetical protein